MPPTTFGTTFLKHRIVPAWILWALAMMTNALLGVLIQKHVSNHTLPSGVVLYDLGFELLPFIPSKSLGFSLPDLCTLISATLIAVNLNVTFAPQFSVIVLRRLLCISAVAYFGRAISVPMTLLPNPDLDCVPKHVESVVMSALMVPFGEAVTCTDVFYSGHTIPITCAILLWRDYMRLNPLRILGLTVSTLSLFGIVATHFHYTLDVCYGFFVTWAVWRIYHFVIQCPSVVYSCPIICWFEQLEPMSTIPAGILKIDFSTDPRITWSCPPEKLDKIPTLITRYQLIVLAIVALCLSPSWIALFNT